jgi:putative ABC transport system substrate-binding protein
VRRREFITLLGGAAAAWPLDAWAQQSATVARIGFLGPAPASSYWPRVEGLLAGLRDLGYVEGKNIVIEFRWAERVEQLPELAAELVRMKVDIIFASSSTFVEPARQATKTIPIVFATHADPIGVGHVVSLARPGGNITGLSMLLTDLVAKELEIFKEAMPQATRIGILWNPTTPSRGPAVQAVQAAGEKLGVQLLMVSARTVEEFDGAFATMTRERAGGFLNVASPLSVSQRVPLAELALKQPRAIHWRRSRNSFQSDRPRSSELTVLLETATSSVCPSGCARTTASVAILPAAPGRFSTTNGWLNRSDNHWPIMRATMSAVPPAGKPTIIRTGRDGQACARGFVAVRQTFALRRHGGEVSRGRPHRIDRRLFGSRRGRGEPPRHRSQVDISICVLAADQKAPSRYRSERCK